MTKIPQSVIEEMRTKITPFDTEVQRDVYRSGHFHNADRVINLDKRYRWDLAHAVLGSGFICDLYDAHGVDDSHVDTALRQIVGPL